MFTALTHQSSLFTLGSIQASLMLLSLIHSLKGGAEDNILGITGNSTFVLSPKEGPVIEVFIMMSDVSYLNDATGA